MWLINEINDAYKNGEYEETIMYFEKYLDSGMAICDSIFNTYINAQMKLGLFDEAAKNTEIMIKLFPNFYNKSRQAFNFATCGRIDKLDELIKSENFTSIDYYYIARNCFSAGYYDKAKELFSMCVAKSNDAITIGKAKEFLTKIQIYEKNKKVFRELNYARFKNNGNKITSGHVIYITRLRDEYKENQRNEDPKKLARSYMVWRTIGDKIYAFPITHNTSSRYCLYHQNYNNLHDDRGIKDSLVCLQDSDIERVIDFVRPKDFRIILSNLYYAMCCHYYEVSDDMRFFVDVINSEFKIKELSVMGIPDYKEKRKRTYLNLGLDEECNKYKTLEIKKNQEYKYEVISDDIILMERPERLLFIETLTNDEKTKILKQFNYDRDKNKIKVIKK